jgi:hypothetical protein
MFVALLGFGRRIKEMIRLKPEQIWMCNATRHHRPLLSSSLHYRHVRCAVGICRSYQRSDTVKSWACLDVQRVTSPPSAPLVFFTFEVLLAPVANWEPHGVTLAGCCYVMRHGMKVQIVTPYRVSQLQRYGITARGNVTSVYPALIFTTEHEITIKKKQSVFMRCKCYFASVFYTAQANNKFCGISHLFTWYRPYQEEWDGRGM